MSRSFRHVSIAASLLALVLLFAPPAFAQDAAPDPEPAPESQAGPPCQGSIDFLAQAYRSDPATRAAFQAAYDGLQPLPHGYSYGGSSENPWRSAGDGAGLARAVGEFYAEVCTLLPQILGTNDNALDSIQYFAWFYYHNDAGRRLVEGVDPNDPSKPLTAVQEFLIRFNREYKDFMDSPASAAVVAEWIADPRLEIEDYVLTEPSEYSNWNQFFARNLKRDGASYPSRPVTMPDRDYVVVSPTDCIMNPLVQPILAKDGEVHRALIENPLQRDTVLDVKGIPISVDQLLANTPDDLKAKFEGGSGLACVLMPNTYHHFHSPVDGIIRHHEIVQAGPGDPYAWGTFGYGDWPNWVPLDGNVGRPGTDFSQFQGFQRGVIVIEVSYDNLPGKDPAKLTGWVASIPVGLDTVGSVVFHPDVRRDVRVKKGVTPFGNFYFGGSLNILLFSPIEGFPAQMVSPAVQTRMGNQIGILNTPYPGPPTPWTPGAGRSRDRRVRHGEAAEN